MRTSPQHIWDVWETGDYTGENRPAGRVTVEADFELITNPQSPSAQFAGPSRYWVDTSNPRDEDEIPNVRSISTDFDAEADTATCTIEFFNTLIDPTPVAAGAIPMIVATPTTDGSDPGYLHGAIVAGDIKIYLSDCTADTIGTSPSSIWNTCGWLLYPGEHGGDNTSVTTLGGSLTSFYFSGNATSTFDTSTLTDGTYTVIAFTNDAVSPSTVRATFQVDNASLDSNQTVVDLTAGTLDGPLAPTLNNAGSIEFTNGTEHRPTLYTQTLGNSGTFEFTVGPIAADEATVVVARHDDNTGQFVALVGIQHGTGELWFTTDERGIAAREHVVTNLAGSRTARLTVTGSLAVMRIYNGATLEATHRFALPESGTGDRWGTASLPRYSARSTLQGPVQFSDTDDFKFVPAPTSPVAHLASGSDPNSLGQPGFLSPTYGETQIATNTWGQTQNSWFDVLVPNALIRTYEGYGGHDKTLADAVNDGNLARSGTWLIDDVTIGFDGILRVTARDMHKLPVEQILIPPVVPAEVYPPDVRRFSNFTDANDREQGIIRARCVSASTDVWYGRNAAVNDINGDPHRPTFVQDGSNATFWLSREYSQASGDDAYPWLEFDIGGLEVSAVTIRAHSSYQVYISILRNGEWQGTNTIPYTATGNAVPTTGRAVDTGAAIPYVSVTGALLPGVDTPINLANAEASDLVRLTFTNLDVDAANFTGHRALIYEVTFNTGDDTAFTNSVAIATHPTRQGGYVGATSLGNVFAFGAATNLGDPSTEPLSQPIVDMAYTPDGGGYWVVGADGGVFSFGTAVYYGAVTEFTTTRTDIQAIMSTRTGAGYWIVAADGAVFAFGDATALDTPTITSTAVDIDAGGTPNGAIIIEDTGIVHSVGDAPATANTTGTLAAVAYSQSSADYWTVTDTGTVVASNAAKDFGDLAGGGTDIVDIVITSTENGYWLISALGEIYAYGDATPPIDYESGTVGNPAGIAAPAVGNEGYWMVTDAGEFYAFRDAGYITAPVIANVVDIAGERNATGSAYLLLGSDGGVEPRGYPTSPFGFYGTVATHTTNPATISNAVAIADRTGGYWIFADDGNVWNFGASVDYGSITITSPLVDAHGIQDGYVCVEANGGVHARGTLVNYLGAANLDTGTTAVAITGRYTDGGSGTSAEAYWVCGSNGKVYTFGNGQTFENVENLVPAGRTVVDFFIDVDEQWGALLLDNAGIIPFGANGYTYNFTSTLSAPIVGAAAAGTGLRAVDETGRVYSFNTNGLIGSSDLPRSNLTPDEPIIDIDTDSNGDYLLLSTDGGVFNFGTGVTDNAFAGVTGNNAMAITLTDDSTAAWVLTTTGESFPLGTGSALSNPTPATSFVDGATDWDNDGFFLLDANGQVIPVLSAAYYGDYTGGGAATGIDSTEGGYLVTNSAGVVQTFGGINNFGDESAAVATDGTNIVDIAVRTDNEGYLTIASTGQVYASGTYYAGSPFELLNAGLIDGTITDYADMVRILLSWAGQWAFPLLDAGETVVWGFLEPTGTYPAAPLPADMFSKRPVIDAINEIAEAVSYLVFANRDGKSYFISRNRWQRGNFDHDTDTYTNFVPIISATGNTLLAGSITLPGTSLVSEIIVATVDPTVTQDATRTTRLTPDSAADMKGIERPLVWVNQAFTDEFERELMADLIGLQIHFRRRVGTVTIPGNPLIDPDDQVQILERTSASAAYHYVSKVSTSLDLVSGQYQTTLTTHWLGDTDNWVADNLTLSQRTREYLEANSRHFT